MAFDAEIEDAIVAALQGTNAFDAIYTNRQTGDEAAEDLTAVSVEPIDGNEVDSWDDTAGYLVVDERMSIVFMVRGQDPSARDLTLKQVFSTAQNVLNGQSFGGLTCPGFTRFRSWKRESRVSSEDKLTTVFQYRYLVAPWTGFDITAT